MQQNESTNSTPKYSSPKELGIQDPKTRLKQLSDRASKVVMNPHLQPKRYYRSGIEMLRMANVYMSEKSYEDAYILYMKFITIFVEKIREHPLFYTVTAEDKAMNQQALRDVIPKAEELKKRLLAQYETELNKYLEDAKERERAEEEKLKREELQRLKEEQIRKNKLAEVAATKVAKPTVTIAGAKEDEQAYYVNPSAPPMPFVASHNYSITPTIKDKQVPVIDRSTKPNLVAGDAYGLRDIIVPNELIRKFLSLAFSNTANNKETCGILAGKLDRNKLVITHLLIPQQTGSPDSCATHNEEDIFEYQDRHNLITLGWIHTHPTQTAFLSSVDLHTHCSYQLMMSEAIAIVCAPKYDETGFFTLTPEYGLEFIANCRESGFHPHPTNPPLYMEAKHCKLDSLAAVEVVDLRRR